MLLLFSSRSAPEESVKCWVISVEWWVMSDEWWVIYLLVGRCFISRPDSHGLSLRESVATAAIPKIGVRAIVHVSFWGSAEESPGRANLADLILLRHRWRSVERWVLSFECWVLSVEWYISLAGDVFRHFILTFHVSKSIKPRPAVQNSRRGYFYE